MGKKQEKKAWKTRMNCSYRAKIAALWRHFKMRNCWRFLRTGTPGKTVFTLAKDLIGHFGSLYGLMTAELAEFAHVEGIGVAKYAQLKGIAELARRLCSYAGGGPDTDSCDDARVSAKSVNRY